MGKKFNSTQTLINPSNIKTTIVLGQHIYVPSKISFDPHFLEIGPQFPSLIPNLANFVDNPKLGTKVKIGGELGMIL